MNLGTGNTEQLPPIHYYPAVHFAAAPRLVAHLQVEGLGNFTWPEVKPRHLGKPLGLRDQRVCFARSAGASLAHWPAFVEAPRGAQ